MCINESRGESPVVTVHHEVDGRERAKCSFLALEHFIGDNPTPEWVERCRCEELIPRVGTDIEIIERQL